MTVFLTDRIPTPSYLLFSSFFSWVAIDLGRGRRLIPSHYCLRHGAAAAPGNALRSWDLRVKVHHSGPWVTIDSHTHDMTLGEQPGATALFTIPPPGTDFLTVGQQQQDQDQDQDQKQEQQEQKHPMDLHLPQPQQQKGGEDEEEGVVGVVGHKRQRISTSGKEPLLPPVPPLPPSHSLAQQGPDDSGKNDHSESPFPSPTSPASSSPSSPSFEGYRYFLLLQTGPNSSGNDCLFLGGWEL